MSQPTTSKTSEQQTWSKLIEQATHKLEAEGIQDAELNAKLLALHVLGLWKPTELQPFLQQAVESSQRATFNSLLDRRLSHEPLQYITGETEFYGLRLFTTLAALIPRPETELLVEEAIREGQRIQSKKNGKLSIVDIGTGTGAIPIALAHYMPSATILGVDISSDAIALAKRNIDRYKLQSITVSVVDILRNELPVQANSVDLLLSNPPYIGIQEFEALDTEVKDFEPRVALTDEGEGLVFYKRIAEIARQVLSPEGRLIVEMSYDASERVQALLSERGMRVERIVKDLSGIERILVASL